MSAESTVAMPASRQTETGTALANAFGVLESVNEQQDQQEVPKKGNRRRRGRKSQASKGIGVASASQDEKAVNHQEQASNHSRSSSGPIEAVSLADEEAMANSLEERATLWRHWAAHVRFST